MQHQYPINQKQLREYNFKKYRGVAPSWELIKKVISDSGLKFMYKFELVFGIPQQSLKLYKNSHRGLPATYWHIFYDFDSVISVNRKSRYKKKPTKMDTVLGTNKSTINDIRHELQFAGR